MPPTHRLEMGPFYTVINRTARALSVRVDGRSFTFQPGRNPNIPSAVVQYALRQHPRLGTYGGETEGESLLAIEGVTPPAASRMIAPGEEHRGIEKYDRAQFPDTRGAVQFQRVNTAHGPADLGPTVLEGKEKPGTIVLGAYD